jgi:hypothetical protein
MRNNGVEDDGDMEGLHLLGRPGKARARESTNALLNLKVPLKESIRKKVFLSSSIQFGLVLGLVFSFVMALDLVRMRRSFRDAQAAIEKSIVAKGEHQVLRTGMILAALPVNASPSLIREIIDATVASDQDIRYGIFMDPERKPLAFSRAGGTAPGSHAPDRPTGLYTVRADM